MNRFRIILAVIFSARAFLAGAELVVAPDAEPRKILAGCEQTLSVYCRNTGKKPETEEARIRLYQMTSATAALFREMPWKKFTVLPDQTVVETAQVSFPPVKAPTAFVLEWIGGSNRVLGKTEVWVYPTNLLAELGVLMNKGDLGILDPEDEIKPLLRMARVDFVDLDDADVENFRGRLAILRPRPGVISVLKTPGEGLAKRVTALARNDVPVVWISGGNSPVPAGSLRDALRAPLPSYFYVREKKNAVVVVQPGMVFNLRENPVSQLNLIYFCGLALDPQPPRLPDFDPET